MTGGFGFGGLWAIRRSRALAVALVVGAFAVGYGPATAQTAGIGLGAARPAGSSAGDVATSAAIKTAFPLAIKPGRRYLEDAAGTPFLIQGDAAWGLITQLTRADVDRYLDDRQARGFNTVLVSLLGLNDFANAPANAYGQEPFLASGDYDTPNEAYFRHADWVLRRAADKGFLVLLAPSYLGGDGPQEWYRAMVANGPQKLRRYGEYLGRRYAEFSNTLWVHGGDYNPPRRDLVAAIAEGIREFDPDALHTVHGEPNTAALEFWQGEPWLQVDAIYTLKPVYAAALEEYARPEGLPCFLIESAYENEEIYEATERHIRTQAYQAVLSGAAGQVFGNSPVWHFDGREQGVVRTLHNVARVVVGESGTAGRIIDGREQSLLQTISHLVFPGTWPQALASPGAQSMTHLRDLFMSMPWWLLEPDTDDTLLTGGQRAGFERAVAARTADQSIAVLYLPSSREITIDLRKLTGPKIAAHWYDPADGRSSAVSGSPFPATGSRHFRPEPVDNSSGFDDWVLILESLPSGSVEQLSEARAQPLGQDP
jgi:Protein of unknown function (DUF4038)/Putative collagen-binding domain of a collagenase